VWDPALAPEGPIVVVVSLTEQRAYVYRNGVQIGFTTVSTGKPGHETPTGIFTILQKDKDHRSSKYNNAPMPYQERLTWDAWRCMRAACRATPSRTAACTCRRSSRRNCLPPATSA